MHAAAFEYLGLPHRYGAFHVRPEGLEAALRGAAALGFGGLNLTLPHKVKGHALMDRLGPEAERIGAVNTVCFEGGELVGHNTDGLGFLAALDELDGVGIERATLLGSGGAAISIADALLSSFPQMRLCWVSRHPESLPEHPRVERADYRAVLSLKGELLVNATSVGLRGGPMEFPLSPAIKKMSNRARIVDIVYPRPAGGLLDRGEAEGFAVQDGLPMLLWQGVKALELWLKRSIPADCVEAMRQALTA